MQEVLYIRNAVQGAETRLEVYGAYAIKEALKAQGYRWNAERKAWAKVVEASLKAQFTELSLIFQAALDAGLDWVAGQRVADFCERYGVQARQPEAKRTWPMDPREGAYSLSELHTVIAERREAVTKPDPEAAPAETPEVAAARAEFEQADAAAKRDHYGMAEFALPLNDVTETRGGMEEAQMRFFVDGDGRYRWEAGGRQRFGSRAQALAAYIKALEV